MIKAFNSIKKIFLAFYQVLFVDAKDRYEVTEVYLENSCQSDKTSKVNKRMQNEKDESQRQDESGN